MSFDTFLPNAPEATHSLLLVSETSQLDPSQGPRTSTANSASEQHVVSVHGILATTVDGVERTAYQPTLPFEPIIPIRRLPNEILQLIFVEVHAQSTEEERQNPITAQVCMLWRQLAEATPFLWTSIRVKLGAGDEEVIHAVAQMKIRLERAKQQLVAVKLYTNQLSNSSPSRQNSRLTFNAVVATLLQYKDRVASLRLPCHQGLCGYLARRCATEDVTFHNLHTLFLDEDRYWCYLGNFDAHALLKACPNIRRFHMDESRDFPDIHWEKIKAFKGRLDTRTLSAFISHARVVEEAEIRSTSWYSLPNIIFGNRLTALSLINLRYNCATRLAGAPRPPGLRYLSLAGDFSDAAEALLNSWGPGLEFLAISVGIGAEYFEDDLPTLSTLQGLRLCSHQATPPNFLNLLPQLTHLEIHSGVRGPSEEEVRALLSPLLEPTPSSEQLSIRSVALLQGSHHSDLRPLERVDKHNEVWKDLFQALKDIGIRVHEYRTTELFHTPVFGTPFFDERGWCV